MKFKVITLFPDFLNCLNSFSVIGRAIRNKKITLETINLRDFGLGKYKQVDDRPYGGGIGMLLRVDVLQRALKHASPRKSKKRLIVLVSADGEQFNQRTAEELSKFEEVVLICGHYEGYDHRVESLVDKKLSLGRFIVTGGEIPAMTIIDSVSRLMPGVLGKDESSEVESYAIHNGHEVIEYPQYTRPYDFKGEKVPEILLSGDHKKILAWQEKQLKKTNAVD